MCVTWWNVEGLKRATSLFGPNVLLQTQLFLLTVATLVPLEHEQHCHTFPQTSSLSLRLEREIEEVGVLKERYTAMIQTQGVALCWSGLTLNLFEWLYKRLGFF